MVKHIVIFKFSGTKEQRLATAKTFKAALESLPEQIAELKSIEVGININSTEDNDLVLTAKAETLEDVAKYSAHPAHVAAVTLVKPMIASRACVDYTVSD